MGSSVPSDHETDGAASEIRLEQVASCFAVASSKLTSDPSQRRPCLGGILVILIETLGSRRSLVNSSSFTLQGGIFTLQGGIANNLRTARVSPTSPCSMPEAGARSRLSACEL
jgi:hypothetical protein